MTGKTIRIFLADGEPTGVLLAEISNWTGKVLVAPRSQLDQLSKREEVRAPASTCSSVPTRTIRRGRWPTSARATTSSSGCCATTRTRTSPSPTHRSVASAHGVSQAGRRLDDYTETPRLLALRSRPCCCRRLARRDAALPPGPRPDRIRGAGGGERRRRSCSSRAGSSRRSRRNCWQSSTADDRQSVSGVTVTSAKLMVGSLSCPHGARLVIISRYSRAEE